MVAYCPLCQMPYQEPTSVLDIFTAVLRSICYVLIEDVKPSGFTVVTAKVTGRGPESTQAPSSPKPELPTGPHRMTAGSGRREAQAQDRVERDSGGVARQKVVTAIGAGFPGSP